MITEEELELLLSSRSPEAKELIDLCLFHKPADQEQPILKAKDISRWYHTYRTGLMHALDIRRRTGTAKLATTIGERDIESFLKLESELIQSVGMPSGLIPSVILEGALLYSGCVSFSEKNLKDLLSYCKSIAEGHVRILEGSTSVTDWEAERLLHYIKMEEPCKWSSVARHLSVQRKSEYHHTMERLIQSGRIEIDEDGCYRTLSEAVA